MDGEDKVIVAISGGVDSVVMAHLFHTSNYHYALAHCNFQLRGEESDRDEELVRSLAQEWGCRVYTKKFDTRNYASENRVSTQVAARDLRYGWFRELADGEGFNKIATAHHKSDLAETVLLNLARGTGLSGLQGIPVIRDNIIRPILFANREEILEYARENALEWREDQTNQESKYARNMVRNEIMPLLEKINPGVQENINRTANYLTEVRVLVDQQMKSIENQSVSIKGPDTIVRIDSIMDQVRSPFLSHYLLRFGFNHSQIVNVISGLDTVGALFQSSEFQLNIDREKIVISPISDELEKYEVDESTGLLETKFLDMTFEELENPGFEISPEPSVCCLDLEEISYPLRIRTWESGDQFIPLGMKGKKKLSDFMIDEKIPLNLKRRQLVVTSGKNIVWVVGRRIADPFKIKKTTKRVLQIKLQMHA